MRLNRLRQSIVAILVLVAFMCQGTWVLAQTTGSLNGTVTETGTTTPIAGAKVTADSPSQSSSTTTDSNGRFTFISLPPDTYTLSIEKEGYDPASISGITVFALQSQTVQLSTTRTLRVIGRVTSRANSDLIRPGQTSNVYSVSASQANAVQGLGGGGSMNQAYSAMASVPGVFIPQGQAGWAQSVYVRGGNYTEVGYEYDGVPIQRAFDQYPGSTLSSLGQQEVQIYNGSAPAAAQSDGLAGFVNQVIKNGTYPGFGTGTAQIGSPSFYHAAKAELGGATPERNFTYYAAAFGSNQMNRYGSQYNGANFSQLYGQPYNTVCFNAGTANPGGGCYANGGPILGAAPNGMALGPVTFGTPGLYADRETVANIHIRIPHANSDLKDDIQILGSTSLLKQNWQEGFSDWGANGVNVANGSAVLGGVTYPNCSSAPAFNNCALFPGNAQYYLDGQLFNAPLGVPLTSSMLTQTAPYLAPQSPTNRPLGALIPATSQDFYDIQAGIGKIQYQKNFSDRSFLRVYGYTFYSAWLNNGANGLTGFFTGSVPADYVLTAHDSGGALTYLNQINDFNTINLTAGYTQASTVRWNNYTADGLAANGGDVALMVNSLNPTGGCYGPTGAGIGLVPCTGGAAYGYKFGAALGGPLAPIQAGQPSVAAVGTTTCGSGPCEYLTTDSGLVGRYNAVKPQFTNVSLADTWKPTDKITVDAALKYENFDYQLPNSTIQAGPLPAAINGLPRQLFLNNYNMWTCINPVTAAAVAATAPNTCPAGTVSANYSDVSPSSNIYSAISPRLAVNYTINPLNVVNFSIGRYLQPASSAFQQYNSAQSNLFNDVSPASNQLFYLNGYDNPSRYIYPEDSSVIEASWEHQFNGSDAAMKITPFYRRTQGEIYNVVLDPKTNFVSGINVGNKKVFGVEFLARKGSFDRNGFAGQLAYTYTYATINYAQFPNGQTLVSPVNQSIVQYNAYTSFCASNPKNVKCTDPAGNTVLPTNGVTAAPCYTSTGAADPSCAAGDIANPYWNAPAQALFSNSTSYVPFNQLPGTGLSGVSSSYIIPHVATLVLNYKHDQWSLTPTVQFTAGGKYGSPVNGIGINPASGCAPLASGSVVGDPRYPYGATGGSPYDASTCTSTLTAPDQYTGQFDNFGAFTEPSQLTLNLQLTYQVSKNISLQLTGVNLYNRCFGGSALPWTNVGTVLGCWYGTPPYGWAGNSYNPGDSFQPFLQYPYQPIVGYNASQQAYGVQSNPFQLFVTATFRL